MREYHTYQFSKKEWSMIVLKYIIWLGFHAYLFFNSVAGMIILLPLLFPKLKQEKEKAIIRRKEQMIRELKEVLGSVQVALEAGYSLENSFLIAKKELEQLVGKNPSCMLEELQLLERKLSMSIKIEEIWEDFAQRSGIEEIDNLAQVIILGKRSGGNLIHIIRKMHVSLMNKWDVEEEIITMVSGKKMEQRIMSYMPVGILLYMRVMNGDYIQALYGNPVGIIAGIVAIMIMQWAEHYAAKVIQIEV